jgi:hypothetical protein
VERIAGTLRDLEVDPSGHQEEKAMGRGLRIGAQRMSLKGYWTGVLHLGQLTLAAYLCEPSAAARNGKLSISFAASAAAPSFTSSQVFNGDV